MDHLREDVIGKTLDADIAKLCNKDAAADGLSKTLSMSSSFMAPIASFEQLKTDTAIASKNTVFAKESTMELAEATVVYGYIIIEELPS